MTPNELYPDADAITQLRRLFPRFAAMSTGDLETLFHRTDARVVEDQPRDFVLRKDQPVSEISCLISGWAIRYLVLSDGRRQILAIKTPGSYVCVHALCATHLPFSVQTLTPTRRIVMNIDSLVDAIRDMPAVRQLFYALGCDDLAGAEETLTGLGRRDATQNISRLILKLYAMQRTVGLTTRPAFDFPLRQTHIADATGLTTVHVNRILRQLRNAQIITLDKGMIEIHDVDALLELADMAHGDLELYSPLPRGWDRLMATNESTD